MPKLDQTTDNSIMRQKPEQLTQFQMLFVREYLIDLNATQAWIRAGGEPLYAQRNAAKAMKAGTLVASAIARAMAERSARTGISGDRVLRELGRLAFGDTRVLFREDGSLKPPAEYNEDDSAMIEGIKTRRIVEVGLKEDGTQGMIPVEIQEVKLASKTTALGMLMRHLGMNNDKLDVTVQPLAAALDAAYRRTNTARPTIEEDDGAPAIEADYEVLDDEALEAFGKEPANDELKDLLS